MGKYLEKVFRLSQYGTNIKTEMIAGITTFVTMAYVLATVPNMLGSAGLNKSAVMTAVILLIVITTCAMAFYTNRPFALAPGLGSTGIVVSMITNEGISPEKAAGVIFLSGILFIAISFLGLREAVVKVIPVSLKHAVSAGIGLFIPDFFSTFGTVLGVGAKAGYLDEKGNLPGIEKCFQVDAVSTSVGALFGIPSMTTYLESSAGVEAGGKTGLTVIFTGICFLLMLFFSPIVLMIPTAATAPVLIYIGIHMLGAMKNIDYSDITEYMPAFLCIGFTIFANNIANGICIAIPVYVLMKLISGKVKEIQPVMYIVTAICILYFITLI